MEEGPKAEEGGTLSGKYNQLGLMVFVNYLYHIELMSRIRIVSSYYGVPSTSPRLYDALCCGKAA